MKNILLAITLLFLLASFNSTLQEIFAEGTYEQLAPPLGELKEEYSISTIVDVGCATLYEEKMAQADLILCSNTFDYFSYRDIGNALEHFKKSQSRYLMAGTCPNLKKNEETATGKKRNINLQIFPFYFPEPLTRIKDPSTEGRYWGLWKLEEIDLKRFEAYAFPPLTVLTKPVGKSLMAEHAAVAGSARRGLKRVHRNYNFNPDQMDDVLENVVVITDLRAGLQAYEWKKEQKIKTLMVGPNFAPSEGNFFISWPLLNYYLCNSEWPALNLTQRFPSLENRIRIWYAGVDETYWKPSVKFKDKNTKQVLLYCKTDEDLWGQARKCLETAGYHVIPIYYGRYTMEEFRSLLEKVKFAVFISKSESQGIALLESWSMDVPVLAWNPKTSFDWDGHTWSHVSSCPYMNPKVGTDWKEIEELKVILSRFDEISKTFEPRRWVLLHMTDKISIETLLSHIREASVDISPQPPNR